MEPWMVIVGIMLIGLAALALLTAAAMGDDD